MELTIKDKAPPSYDPPAMRNRARLHTTVDMINGKVRRRADGGLLLLTVRVGGQSIDCILLELAILLPHLGSLVLCVNLTLHCDLLSLNRRTLPRGSFLGELSLIKKSHRPARISRFFRVAVDGSKMKFDEFGWLFERPESTRHHRESGATQRKRKIRSKKFLEMRSNGRLLSNADSLAPPVLRSRRCSLRFHPISFPFVTFSPVEPSRFSSVSREVGRWIQFGGVFCRKAQNFFRDLKNRCPLVNLCRDRGRGGDRIANGI